MNIETPLILINCSKYNNRKCQSSIIMEPLPFKSSLRWHFWKRCWIRGRYFHLLAKIRPPIATPGLPPSFVRLISSLHCIGFKTCSVYTKLIIRPCHTNSSNPPFFLVFINSKLSWRMLAPLQRQSALPGWWPTNDFMMKRGCCENVWKFIQGLELSPWLWL